MARLITRGRFTHDYVKGLLAAPEDREPVVRKLVESAGGKLVNFYFTMPAVYRRPSAPDEIEPCVEQSTVQSLTGKQWQ